MNVLGVQLHLPTLPATAGAVILASFAWWAMDAIMPPPGMEASISRFAGCLWGGIAAGSGVRLNQGWRHWVVLLGSTGVALLALSAGLFLARLAGFVPTPG